MSFIANKLIQRKRTRLIRRSDRLSPYRRGRTALATRYRRGQRKSAERSRKRKLLSKTARFLAYKIRSKVWSANFCSEIFQPKLSQKIDWTRVWQSLGDFNNKKDLRMKNVNEICVMCSRVLKVFANTMDHGS